MLAFCLLRFGVCVARSAEHPRTVLRPATAVRAVTIRLDPVPFWAAVTVAIVVALDLVAVLLAAVGVDFAGFGVLSGLVDVGREASLGTWLNSSLLAVAALAAAGCALALRRRDPRRSWLAWCGIAFVLCAASIDEIVQLHESGNQFVARLFPTAESLPWPWVLAGSAAVIVVAAGLGPLVWRLAAPVRTWLLVAAVLYVGGALGVEMLSAPIYPGEGVPHLGYDVLNAAEEGLEMIGVVAVIRAAALQLGLLGGATFELASR